VSAGTSFPERRYLEAFYPEPLPRSFPPAKTVTTTLRKSTKELLSPCEEKQILPVAAQLLAKYLQLQQEFGKDNLAACHAYVTQVKEK
jgi:hypothetical protein